MTGSAAEIEAWITADPDPATRAELRALLNDDRHGELADRFARPLSFGTAGLRGPVRAGPNGMNVAVVIRTTAGLAEWLRTHGFGGGLVVVGRDARHGSADFAYVAAEVLAAAGFDTRAFAEPLPTPLLAYATRSLGAVAGVQITASHNPPADNGYKVYLGGGEQIVPPADGEIEAAITVVGPATEVPRGPYGRIDDDVVESYLRRVASLPVGRARQLRIAVTPIHGVGGEVCREALRRAGFDDVHLVAAQAEPDPDFPTVAFPNPEEPGAADALLELAAEVNADLAVALDPDADRCALGVRGPDGWRMLRGDETGVLLGAHVLDATRHADPLVASTIVSSQLLGRVALARGARHVQTLTGFKWLVRAGDGLVYAYEEAIGHCVDPDVVRDKDGISAAVVAADLAATLRAQSRTLLDVLDTYHLDHGLHVGDQLSVRVAEPAQIATMMAALRAKLPTRLAGVPVSAQDLRPDTDAVILTGDGVRVVVRPSGTEPKLKAYLEVMVPVDGRGQLPAAEMLAAQRLSTVRGELSSALGIRN